MNKEIYAIFGTGAAILLAIWMTWGDVTDELVDLNSRVGRIEGVLLARGEITLAELSDPHTAAAAQPSAEPLDLSGR